MTQELKGERILILGAGIMQGPAIAIARSMGLYTVAVDGDPRALEAPNADRFECVDLKDKEGIEALARELQSHGGLSGVMTAGTDFSASAAWVAEKLGLPGIPYEAALNASDKDRMRRRFAAAGVPSPGFAVFAAETAGNAAKGLPFAFPAVVKPVDNMGARGCRRVDSPRELTPALTEALRFSRSGRAIVEEFMEGPEFSVDALVYKDDIRVCGFADRHIFFPPCFIEMGHTMPSALGEAETQALLGVFFAGIRALGITAGYGAAKGDLKLTPQGPMIGEIAARLSGGYMSGWTYPYASGVEAARGAIFAALGRPWKPRPRRNWTSAERAVISIPGVVRSIHGLEQARATERVKNVFLRIEAGSAVRFPENNVAKCGNVISAAPDRAAAVEAAEKAVRAILIRLEAGQGDTAAFLESEDSAFPPDAYALPPELRILLDRLPALPETPPELDAASRVAIHPFPEFAESALTDFAGRTPRESLEAIRTLIALPLPMLDMTKQETPIVLGRPFWRSLIRGGYQGAVYYLDALLQPDRKRGPAIP
ncbi:MAG: ATP-grasp domain-containing protein [Treponema sp.]|jgi:biotin carboxylase|nr:ATP-grasp domain-containing protein [Treponema sp.]